MIYDIRQEGKGSVWYDIYMNCYCIVVVVVLIRKLCQFTMCVITCLFSKEMYYKRNRLAVETSLSVMSMYTSHLAKYKRHQNKLPRRQFIFHFYPI